MSSTLITDYFGRGLLSERPASPNVPEDCCAFYFATDTNKSYVWSGEDWLEIGAPGAEGLTIVQSKLVSISNVSAGVTMDTAPTAGNTLICITLLAQNGASQNNEADGWSRIANNEGNTGIGIYVKTLTGTPSTAQDPVVDAVAGVLYVLEIEGGVGIGVGTGFPYGLDNTVNWLYSVTGSVTNYTFSFGAPGVPWSGLVILIGGRRANNDAGTMTGDGVDGGSVLGGGTTPSARVRLITVSRNDTPSVNHSFAGGAATTYRAAIALIPGG